MQVNSDKVGYLQCKCRPARGTGDIVDNIHHYPLRTVNDLLTIKTSKILNNLILKPELVLNNVTRALPKGLRSFKTDN